jgi:hypothetical protein
VQASNECRKPLCNEFASYEAMECSALPLQKATFPRPIGSLDAGQESFGST